MEETLQVIIDADRIRSRISELAKEISDDYRDIRPIFVAVLKGSFVFVADLVRELDIDFVVDFIAIGSYGAGQSSTGAVKLIKDLSHDISGEHVIFVEDVVDSGNTLSYIYANFMARKPKSLEVVTLLNKMENRETDLSIKYVGFDIPGDFVVGYGLDLDEKYRGLPYIARMKGNEDI